ncbi:sucrose-6-phosphate hydrolase [Halobacillus sp. Marseille-P3879]|uniref:sucrose-6-phosphate hydrolase n=1 Tax=Halobacillus sp. Marseille-P3879 TaxID=2045014 RepID=UPI000C7ACA25|nr:sucrose-6-phosphate hydrolase [Halobacillus sp. Marseille-P3879]
MNEDVKLRKQADDAVNQHFQHVKEDAYFPGYHTAPPVGLLNDPNGWIQWKGRYHLFFQWMPFHTGHGAKLWGHFTSENLVDWQFEPAALTPSDWFDKNGCYSGSAVADEEKLKVFYTGNVKDTQGNRKTYQCSAESRDGVNFDKKGVRIELPEGYTPHFRDPKVWKHDNLWYMVIGAQTIDKIGSAVLFASPDLEEWTHRGILTHAEEEPFEKLGYMWECPDIFKLEDKDIFLFSPQGLVSQGIHYNNQYQCGYTVGHLNYEKSNFSHGEFIELDRGFEFYAPQTTLDDKGRRILIGWMGVPEQNEAAQPTVENGWVHQMTLPRQLALQKGKLYQRPLEEFKQLRTGEAKRLIIDGEYFTSISRTSEVELIGEAEKVSIFDYALLSYNSETGLATLERPSYVDGTKETRSCYLPNGLERLHIFVDHSSLEVFINDGEEVFTARIFAQPGNDSLTINTRNSSQVQIWSLRNDTIHIR